MKTGNKEHKSSVGTRGREFTGRVINRLGNRIVIEFERTIFVHKYERFNKRKTRIHARLPDSLKDVQVGDLISVRECRPLSKLIHHVAVRAIKEDK